MTSNFSAKFCFFLLYFFFCFGTTCIFLTWLIWLFCVSSAFYNLQCNFNSEIAFFSLLMVFSSLGQILFLSLTFLFSSHLTSTFERHFLCVCVCVFRESNLDVFWSFLFLVLIIKIIIFLSSFRRMFSSSRAAESFYKPQIGFWNREPTKSGFDMKRVHWAFESR